MPPRPRWCRRPRRCRGGPDGGAAPTIVLLRSARRRAALISPQPVAVRPAVALWEAVTPDGRRRPVASARRWVAVAAAAPRRPARPPADPPPPESTRAHQSSTRSAIRLRAAVARARRWIAADREA